MKVINGAVVVQMLNPKTATVFIPYVTSQLQSAQQMDIIWDTYKDNRLKSGTRDQRGSGVQCCVTLSIKIPPN